MWHPDNDSSQQQELGKDLRSFLSEALAADQHYKLRRLEDTIIPLILYDNAPMDIEAFMKTSIDERIKLKEKIDQLLPTSIEQEAIVQAEFNAIERIEEPGLIAELINDITRLAQDSDDIIELKKFT